MIYSQKILIAIDTTVQHAKYANFYHSMLLLFCSQATIKTFVSTSSTGKSTLLKWTTIYLHNANKFVL